MTQNLRSIALLAVLVLVGIATLLVTYARPTPTPPLPPTPVAASTPTPMFSYLIDVAGWYEITPNESAVASPIDLSIDGLKALPTTVGNWSGQPYTLGPAVDEWFDNPDLALSNLYQDDKGHQAWFSTFGSRSRKSYFLFEHTPITSYPSAGWTIVDSGVTQIPIGNGHINVNKATLTKDTERRVVFYWYLWNNFDRDPEKGVLSIRLHVPVVTTDQDAFQAGVDLLRSIFPQTIPWKRF